MVQAQDKRAILWTSDEAAAYLRVNVQTVQRWAKQGKIPAAKIGKEYRYDPLTITHWANARKAGVQE